MEARAYSEADIVFSAGRGSHRFSDRVLFEISGPLYWRALWDHARRWFGSGIDAMALAIGKKSPVFVEGYFATDRRFLCGAGRAYFACLVELKRGCHVKAI